MRITPKRLPDDIETLKRLLVEKQSLIDERDAQLATAQQHTLHLRVWIEKLELQIARLKRMQFGRSAERLEQIDQLELIVEDLQTSQAQTRPVTPAPALAKRAPARKPLPAHLPRETVRHKPDSCCPDCGSRMSAIGEDIAEMLEYVPSHFKVIRMCARG